MERLVRRALKVDEGGLTVALNEHYLAFVRDLVDAVEELSKVEKDEKSSGCGAFFRTFDLERFGL